MKQSVTVGAQLLWSSRYGCNNGRYGCTIVMSYIEINKTVSQWLLTFNLCVSATWPLTCAFHIPCMHTPEIIDMHRGMCDNDFYYFCIAYKCGWGRGFFKGGDHLQPCGQVLYSIYGHHRWVDKIPGCFPCWYFQQTVQQTLELSVTSDVLTPIWRTLVYEIGWRVSVFCHGKILTDFSYIFWDEPTALHWGNRMFAPIPVKQLHEFNNNWWYVLHFT